MRTVRQSFNADMHPGITGISESMIYTEAVIKLAICFATQLLAVGCSASEVETTPTTPDTSLPLDLGSFFATGKLTISNSIFGAVMIIIGLLLSFAGKRFFKVFLSLVGLVAGATLGFITMGFIGRQQLVVIPNFTMITYVVMGVLGLLAAACFLYLWKLGVYAGSGLGGYFLVLYINGLKEGGLIPNFAGRQTALIIGIGLGVLGAMFLEDVAIALASSMVGSLVAVLGLDVFVQTNFRQQILEQAMWGSFRMPAFTGSMYYMFGLTVALAVSGIVFQLVFPRTKGYGRMR
jgi:hypothetical protein